MSRKVRRNRLHFFARSRPLIVGAVAFFAGQNLAQAGNLVTPPVSDPTPASPSEEASQPSDPAPESDAGEVAPAEPVRKPHKLAAVQLPKIGNTQAWVRNSTYADYFRDNYNNLTNDDKFLAIVNYTSLGTENRFKNWTLSTSLRFDTINNINLKSQPLCDSSGDGEVSGFEAAACQYHPDPNNPKKWDKRIERLSLRATHKYFELTLGDFNVNFGRGMGLTVRKVNEITIDATIKGARLDLKSKNVTVAGLVGVGNRQQSDYVTRKIFTDPGYPHVLCRYMLPGFNTFHNDRLGNRLWTSCSDVVGGARVDAKLPNKINAGAHYSNIWFGKLKGRKHEAMHVIGGDLARARIAKKWDVFAGYTTVLRNYHLRETEPSSVTTGKGFYLSNNIALGNASVLIEGKYYDNFLLAQAADITVVQYGQSPTLEREDQQIPANANSTGGRVRVDYTIPESNLTFHVNGLGYAFGLKDSDPLFRDKESFVTVHGYGGVLWRNDLKGTAIISSGGYRWEGHQTAPEDELSTRYKRKLPHFDFYLSQSLGRRGGFTHSVNFNLTWRLEKQGGSVETEKHFHKGNLTFGYGMAPYLSIALIGGFSSEWAPLLNEPKLHDQPCGDPNSCRRTPHLWPGIEVRAFLTTASFVRVLAGRQVGGLICANGSCRVMPDFEGVRTDLVLEF
jgi:hypothetical protein